jgi:hypothetical protein
MLIFISPLFENLLFQGLGLNIRNFLIEIKFFKEENNNNFFN